MFCDIFRTSFVDPHRRIVQRYAQGHEFTRQTSLYLLTTYLIENLLYLAMITALAVYMVLLSSKAGSYCTQEVGTLQMEGNWLLTLAVVQVILVIIFMCWKWSVTEHERCLREKQRHSENEGNNSWSAEEARSSEKRHNQHSQRSSQEKSRT